MKKLIFIISVLGLTLPAISHAALGDLYYGSSTYSYTTALPIGASSTCLTSNGIIPAWGTSCGTGGSSFSTNPFTATNFTATGTIATSTIPLLNITSSLILGNNIDPTAIYYGANCQNNNPYGCFDIYDAAGNTFYSFSANDGNVALTTPVFAIESNETDFNTTGVIRGDGSVRFSNGGFVINVAGDTTVNSLTNKLCYYDGTSSCGTFGQVLESTSTGSKWVSTSTLGFLASSSIGIGTTGQIPYYSANGRNLTATSTIFLSNGLVGIGTTTPSQAFTVAGSIFITGSATTTNLTATGTLIISGSGNSSFSGNVGIGTTTPPSKLTVQGSDVLSTTFPLLITNSSGTTTFSVSNDGINVGVGNSAFTGMPSNAGGLDVGALNLTMGATNVAGSPRNNSTNKIARFLVPAFNTGQSPVSGFIITTSSGANIGAFGGSSGSFQGLTELDFDTSSAVNTVSPPQRMIIDSSGRVLIGTASAVGFITASSTGTVPTLSITQNSTGPSAVFNGGFVGIGSSTPAGLVSIQAIPTNSAASSLFIIASSSVANTATTTLFNVLGNGHLITGGQAPSVSGGTSSVVGNDSAGTITVVGTALTSITLTFAQPWGANPVCTESDNSTALTADISSVSTTSVTFGFSIGINSGTLWYQCVQ